MFIITRVLAIAAGVAAVLLSVPATAQQTTLERALACELPDSTLPNLMSTLRAQRSEFDRPLFALGAPAFLVFQMRQPASALGYSGNRVVVFGGRVLLVLPTTDLELVARQLSLKRVHSEATSEGGSALAQYARPVRPGAGVFAARSSHVELGGAVLVGCDYAQTSAHEWLGGHNAGARPQPEWR